ncbi:MAG: LysM peptidoglycan-binding domain-containing protein [Flammeovirgaceae bacterium]|nr:LysM peptidoglycan-binding domain-containing protein [Flammeovirgaceae bacterium]
MAMTQPAAEQDSLTAYVEGIDSLKFIPFQAIGEIEYIPGNETPELISDRLSCIEQTIPLPYNDKVHAFINYFLIRNREYTKSMIRRKNLYFPLFEQHLAKYDLPDEIKYLSIIESALNPRAISRARAVGLWQFMAATGRHYGLQNDFYIDERMDPVSSTESACKLLVSLHKMFGDWHLALAAYNSGPGTVRKAIRRSGYKKNFWDIYPYLPKETRAYVPQFIAIIYALNYPEEHNVFEYAREIEMPNDTIKIRGFLNLETLAALTESCMDDLHKLNPSVLRNAIPNDGKPYTIKIPYYSKKVLDLNRIAILDSASHADKEKIEGLAKNAVGNTYGRELIYYRVKSGDVLGVIAQHNKVRVDDLKKWNNLSSNMIYTGQRLAIWVPATSARATTITTPSPKTQPIAQAPVPIDAKVYVVQSGDTLWDISRKYQDLSIEKIKDLNNLKSNTLQPGQKLIISK